MYKYMVLRLAEKEREAGNWGNSINRKKICWESHWGVVDHKLSCDFELN